MRCPRHWSNRWLCVALCLCLRTSSSFSPPAALRSVRTIRYFSSSRPTMSTSAGWQSEKVSLNYAALAPKPDAPHVVISDEELRDIRRLVVVGDVHGCLEELQDLLARCAFDCAAGDRALLVGDLVNKGPLSLETIRFAREQGMLCIRGNHDDFALCHAHGLVPASASEHLSYLRRLDPEDLEWLRQLPYSISVPAWKALFVHAGIVPHVPLERQTFEDLTMMRNLLSLDTDESENNVNSDNSESNSDTASGRWGASSKTDAGCAWADVWDGGAQGVHVYFGHDAKRGLQQRPFATGLDTGCAYGRSLTGIVLPQREIVQVPARRVYQKVSSTD